MLELCDRVGPRARRAATAGEPTFAIPEASITMAFILQLWPHVLAIPTTARLSVRDLIELRAYPVHPLGIVGEATWGDPLASVVPISATRSARESPDRADGDSGQHVHRVLSNEVTPEPLHFGEAE
jgi:hypothetical protein